MTEPVHQQYEALAGAIRRRSKAEALQLVASLAGTQDPGDGAAPERTVKALIDHRWFDLAERLGAWILRQRPAAGGVRRRYGQALLEQGRFVQARGQFERVLGDPQLPRRDRFEVLGLIGRSFKQQFVELERGMGRVEPELLGRAIDQYLAGYAEDESNTWHGINAVALLHLASRHGISHAAVPRLQTLARAIIDTIELGSGIDAWGEATLAEAYIALERWEDAAGHLRRYLWFPGTSAFHFGSTLRQLEEVWSIGGSAHPGEPLVTLLRARLVEVENGAVQLAPADVRGTLRHSDAHYEKVFGTDHFVTLNNYRLGLERCAAVARVGLDVDRGQGTGFLVRGSDLLPALDPLPLLITNAHVVDPTPGRVSAGLPPADVVVTFHSLPGVKPDHSFGVAQVIWSSPRDRLDVTIARLDGDVPLPGPYPFAKQLPAIGARLRAIGHPGGGALSFSLNDNEFLDHEQHLLHYRTPTEGGSSGCPVFTQEWKLVALHHAGRDDMPRLNGKPGTYQANEGIAVIAIREALAEAVATGQIAATAP